MRQEVWTLDRFRRSGMSHLEGARQVLGQTSRRKREGFQVMPGSAAYLAHVALECVLKAHLLYRNGCASAEELKRKQPKEYAALFQGKRGHDLKFLADSLRLPYVLSLMGKQWKGDDECWKRIAASDRPYSLRYGAEDLDTAEVTEELVRASEIIAALLNSTPVVRRSQGQRGRRK